MGKNSLMIIAPYRWGGTWVFDDPVTGLVREPFVAGVPEMIDVLLERKGIKADQFRLIFSATPFPGYDQKIEHVETADGGNYYRSDEFEMIGWLCPALLHYFPIPPREIYVKFEPVAE